MLDFHANPPLGLYIHLPWCVRKCPYCDFNSHTVDGPLPEGAYVDALLRDLEDELPLVWGRRVETVFIGGGTPSLFSPEAMDRLLVGLRALLALRPGTEITLEANPGATDTVHLGELRAAGINRLSLGIQSFDDAALHRLGRIHDGAAAREAVVAARTAGFEALNLDLMHGLPGQDRAGALADLATAIDLGPDHVSWYQLTLEPGTAFGRTPPPDLPDEETLAAIQEAGEERLTAAGFHQYEVSAWARGEPDASGLPRGRCEHNLNYWHFGDYLGIGAGAHGKLTDPAAGTITRRERRRQPQTYLELGGGHATLAETRRLSRADAAFEFLLNALRLRDGFDTALFPAHAGQPLSVLETPLRAAEADGLLFWELHRIRPTELGRRHLDTLLQRFLPEN
ncbi:MAG: radical SAM family heme chaperone HemW [Pseudomonadota bacterium]